MVTANAGMTEGGHIAALLELETGGIDAAGCIDRQHQLKIDRGLRPCRRNHRKHEQQQSNFSPDGAKRNPGASFPRCAEPVIGPRH
jgi:hypothetical protein